MIYSVLFNNQQNAQEAIIMFLFGIIAFFVSLAMHEFAHGFVAYKMGDPTPKAQGRLTLNPIKHLDLTGLLCFMFFGFGWAKPVQINPLNFKKYKKGIRLVSVAGVLMNVLLGLLSAGIYAILMATVGIHGEAMLYVYQLLAMFMLVNSSLAIFNFLPIFPLDGFNFISTFLKPNNKFLSFNVKYGNKILLGVLLGSLIFELLFGFDVLYWLMSLLFNYVFMPIALLGVL